MLPFQICYLYPRLEYTKKKDSLQLRSEVKELHLNFRIVLQLKDLRIIFELAQ